MVKQRDRGCMLNIILGEFRNSVIRRYIFCWLEFMFNFKGCWEMQYFVGSYVLVNIFSIIGVKEYGN